MYQHQFQSDGPPPHHPSVVCQWASKVLGFSSQYDNRGWSAQQTVGQPKVFPRHGDLQGAWASAGYSGLEFIELEYDMPVRPTAINIYETFNPGAVVCVKAKTPGHDEWMVIWKTNTPTTLPDSRIFSPPLPDLATVVPVKQLRIEVDCSRHWSQIDAVQLVGSRPGPAPVHDGHYVEDMKQLVNSPVHSDLELRLDASTVFAHRAIVSVRSPFLARLVSQHKDKKVDLQLPNVSKKDLLAALTFLYTNRLPSDCSVETAVQLCKTSETFEVKDMKTAALHKLTELTTCDNVVSVLMSVDGHPTADDIRAMCIAFMARHINDVSQVPDFDHLPQKYVVQVIQNASESLLMPRSSDK